MTMRLRRTDFIPQQGPNAFLFPITGVLTLRRFALLCCCGLKSARRAMGAHD